MNLRSVLHNVKTAAVLIVQQLLYIHQRKQVSKVRNPFHRINRTKVFYQKNSAMTGLRGINTHQGPLKRGYPNNLVNLTTHVMRSIYS